MKGYLPDQTHLSQVHLRTAHLERTVEFYTCVLQLCLASTTRGRATLSARPQTPGLLVLSEERTAAPRPPHSVGLYHLALRYPTRQALAHAYRRVVKAGYPVAGASDHGVSEAIYLYDPEGNGVELYADRPRSEWSWQDDQIAMVTTPLNLQDLLTSLATPSGAESAQQLDLGHIHLQVADLKTAERFYSEFLGLAVTQRSYPGALFFAAGGYHHHIGVNVWAGKNAPPAHSVGLISYRLEVPVSEILYCLSHRAPLLGYETRTELAEGANPVVQIRDPSGTWLEVQASHSESKAAPSPCQTPHPAPAA